MIKHIILSIGVDTEYKQEHKGHYRSYSKRGYKIYIRMYSL